jgi:hypothetical protein
MGAVTLGAFALATGIHALAPGRDDKPPPPGSHPAPVVLVAPATVLARAPYMGVSCPGAPNSIACDRVGLAVWLRRPAVSVDATIGGWPLKLDWAGDRTPAHATPGAKTAFDGFLQPAGLTSHLYVKPDRGTNEWLGDGAPAPVVRLRVNYADGRTSTTELPVSLSSGWG